MAKTKGPVNCNREVLAREVNALLGLKIENHNHIKSSKAMKIVNAIVRAMTEALERGDEIDIPGFGAFKWRKIPEHMGSRVYRYGWDMPHVQTTELIPASKNVYFKPAKELIEFINEGITDGNQESKTG